MDEGSQSSQPAAAAAAPLPAQPSSQEPKGAVREPQSDAAGVSIGAQAPPPAPLTEQPAGTGETEPTSAPAPAAPPAASADDTEASPPPVQAPSPTLPSPQVERSPFPASPESEPDAVPRSMRTMVGECVKVLSGPHAHALGFVTSIVDPTEPGTFTVSIQGHGTVTLPRGHLQRTSSTAAMAAAMGSWIGQAESPPPDGPTRPQRSARRRSESVIQTADVDASSTPQPSQAPTPALPTPTPPTPPSRPQQAGTQPPSPATSTASAPAGSPAQAAAAQQTAPPAAHRSASDDERVADLAHWKAKRGTTLASSMALAAMFEVAGAPESPAPAAAPASQAAGKGRQAALLRRLLADAPLADVAKLRKVAPDQVEAMAERQLQMIMGAASKAPARTPRTRSGGSKHSAGSAGSERGDKPTPRSGASTGHRPARRRSTEPAPGAGTDLSSALEAVASDAKPATTSPAKPAPKGGGDAPQRSSSLIKTPGFSWLWRWVRVAGVRAPGMVVGAGHGFYTVRLAGADLTPQAMADDPTAAFAAYSGGNALLLRRASTLTIMQELLPDPPSTPALPQPVGVEEAHAKGKSKSSSSHDAGGAPKPPASAPARHGSGRRSSVRAAAMAAAAEAAVAAATADPAASPNTLQAADAALAAKLAANERRRSSRSRKPVQYGADAAGEEPAGGDEGAAESDSAVAAEAGGDSQASSTDSTSTVGALLADMGQGVTAAAVAGLQAGLGAPDTAQKWARSVDGEGVWSPKPAPPTPSPPPTGAAPALTSVLPVPTATAPSLPDQKLSTSQQSTSPEAPVPPAPAKSTTAAQPEVSSSPKAAELKPASANPPSKAPSRSQKPGPAASPKSTSSGQSRGGGRKRGRAEPVAAPAAKRPTPGPASGIGPASSESQARTMQDRSHRGPSKSPSPTPSDTRSHSSGTVPPRAGKAAKHKGKQKKHTTTNHTVFVLLFPDGSLRSMAGKPVPSTSLLQHGYTVADLGPASRSSTPSSEGPPPDSTMYISGPVGYTPPSNAAHGHAAHDSAATVQVFRVDPEALLRHPAVVARALSSLAAVSGSAGSLVRGAMEAAGLPGDALPDSLREACALLGVEAEALSASAGQGSTVAKAGGGLGGAPPAASAEEDVDERGGTKNKRLRAAAHAKKRLERVAYHAAFVDYSRRRGFKPLPFEAWCAALSYKDRLRDQVSRVHERMRWESRPDISKRGRFLDLPGHGPPDVLPAIATLEGTVKKTLTKRLRGLGPEDEEAAPDAIRRLQARLAEADAAEAQSTGTADTGGTSTDSGACLASPMQGLQRLVQEGGRPYGIVRLGAGRLRRAAAQVRGEIVSDSSSDEEGPGGGKLYDNGAGAAALAGTRNSSGPAVGSGAPASQGSLPWALRDVPHWEVAKHLFGRPPVQDSCVTVAQPGRGGVTATCQVRVTTAEGKVILVDAAEDADGVVPPIHGRTVPVGPAGSPLLPEDAPRTATTLGWQDDGDDDDSVDGRAGVWGTAVQGPGEGPRHQRPYGGAAVDLAPPSAHCFACGCPKEFPDDHCWDPACYVCPLHAVYMPGADASEPLVAQAAFADELRAALQAAGHSDLSLSGARPTSAGDATTPPPPGALQVPLPHGATLPLPLPPLLPQTPSALAEVASILRAAASAVGGDEEATAAAGTPPPSRAAALHFALLFNRTQRRALGGGKVHSGMPQLEASHAHPFAKAVREKHAPFPRRALLSEPAVRLPGQGREVQAMPKLGATRQKRAVWQDGSVGPGGALARPGHEAGGDSDVESPRPHRRRFVSLAEEVAVDAALRREHGEQYEYAAAHAFGSLPPSSVSSLPHAVLGAHTPSSGPPHAPEHMTGTLAQQAWQAALPENLPDAQVDTAPTAPHNIAQVRGYLTATKPTAGEDWVGGGFVPHPGGTHALPAPGQPAGALPPVHGGRFALHAAASASRRETGAQVVSGPGTARLGAAPEPQASAALKPHSLRHPTLQEEAERISALGGPHLPARKDASGSFGHLASEGGLVVAGITAGVPAELQFEAEDCSQARQLVQRQTDKDLDRVLTLPPPTFDAAGLRIAAPPPPAADPPSPTSLFAQQRLLGVGHSNRNPLALTQQQARVLGACALQGADALSTQGQRKATKPKQLQAAAQRCEGAALTAAARASMVRAPRPGPAKGRKGGGAGGAASAPGAGSKQATEAGKATTPHLRALQRAVVGVACASADGLGVGTAPPAKGTPAQQVAVEAALSALAKPHANTSSRQGNVPHTVRGVQAGAANAAAWRGKRRGVVGVTRGVKRGRLGDALAAHVAVASCYDAALGGLGGHVPYGGPLADTLDAAHSLPQPSTAPASEPDALAMHSLLLDAPVRILTGGAAPRSDALPGPGSVVPVQIAPVSSSDTPLPEAMQQSGLPQVSDVEEWGDLLPPTAPRPGPNTQALAGLGVPLIPDAAPNVHIVAVQPTQAGDVETHPLPQPSAGPRHGIPGLAPSTVAAVTEVSSCPPEDATSWRHAKWQRGDEWQHPDLDVASALMHFKFHQPPSSEAADVAAAQVRAAQLRGETPTADPGQDKVFRAVCCDQPTMWLPDAFAALRAPPVPSCAPPSPRASGGSDSQQESSEDTHESQQTSQS